MAYTFWTQTDGETPIRPGCVVQPCATRLTLGGKEETVYSSVFPAQWRARPAQQTDSGIQIASNSASNPISVIPVPFWAQRPMVFL